MKKLFFLFAAALVSVSVLAEGHMKFKGVEMSGSPKAFVKQLENKGFTYAGNYEGVEILLGDFAGYKDCKIFVISTQDDVVRVNVAFPSYSNWSSLYGNYSSIKEMLTQKYGKPTVDKEEWQGYSTPRDDNGKMHELVMDRAKIFSEFEAQDGSIQLQIMHPDYTSGIVILSYFDNQTQEKIINSAIEDL